MALGTVFKEYSGWMETSHYVKIKQLLYFTWLVARHLIEMLNVLMNDGEIWVKRINTGSVKSTWMAAMLWLQDIKCYMLYYTIRVQQKVFVISGLCKIADYVLQAFLFIFVEKDDYPSQVKDLFAFTLYVKERRRIVERERERSNCVRPK